MIRRQGTPFAAFFWAFLVFFPIALTYLASALLLLCVLAEGLFDRTQMTERFSRLRANPMWWPLVFYVVWTFIVLAVRPHYEQTASNLFHAMRIALTLALALSLTLDESIMAIKGFLTGAVIAISIVGLHYVGLPDMRAWESITRHSGNKSIAVAVLFSLIAASCLVVALQKRGFLRVASLPIAALSLSVAIWTIPSRTSLIVVLMTLVAAAVHQWRARLGVLLGMVLLAAAIGLAVFSAVPQVKSRFVQGVTEVEQAKAGDVSENSWSVRFHMYSETSRMMLDKPFMGWGIGAWTDQWFKRTPPVLHSFNMPHNDFLWMGAQAGVPGAMALLLLFCSGLVRPWQRTDLTGRLAFVAGLTLILTSSVHSANRDAAIGLSLLWIVGIYLRLAQEPGDAIKKIRNHKIFASRPTSLPDPTAPPAPS